VNSNGTALGPGAVTYYRFAGTDGVSGKASGGISSGTSFNLYVNWGDGSPGQYVGKIDPDGFVSGYVLNGGADWKSNEPLKCTMSPSAPPPAGPATPATATVVGVSTTPRAATETS
jgi:hypothetical protein